MEGITGTYVCNRNAGTKAVTRNITVLPNGDLRVAGTYTAEELGTGDGKNSDFVGTQWVALFARGPSATVFTTRFGISKKCSTGRMHPEYHVKYHPESKELQLTPLGACSGEAAPGTTAVRWKLKTLPGTGVTHKKAATI